jgi:hypothetical protein
MRSLILALMGSFAWMFFRGIAHWGWTRFRVEDDDLVVSPVGFLRRKYRFPLASVQLMIVFSPKIRFLPETGLLRIVASGERSVEVLKDHRPDNLLEVAVSFAKLLK